jgi:aryl-alcohol dehydrogenase-like predicted oxidoreductase
LLREFPDAPFAQAAREALRKSLTAENLKQEAAYLRDKGRATFERPYGLAWLLHNPDVTAPIIGPRTMEQFANSMHAVEMSLPPEILQRLDAIWPGPGGEAPEAYAW